MNKSIPCKTEVKPWYRGGLFYLLPDYRYTPENDWNSSSWYFRWLNIQIWSGISPDISADVEFGTDGCWIQCNGFYHHFRFVIFSMPQKLSSLIHRYMWRLGPKHKQSYCQHEFIENNYGGAECKLCHYLRGDWYCPDSHDHRCCYSDSHDSCDFCGEPEERQ